MRRQPVCRWRILCEVEPKIDAKQLDEIVDEMTRIQSAQRETLDKEQAREILRELDLPADRLDEALAAVAVRRELARERAVRWRVAAAVALAIVLIVAVVIWRAHARSTALEHMTASVATLSIGGAPFSGVVTRSARPEVAFEVILVHPPQGRALDVTCDWTGPAGDVRHQNHWQTRTIDTDPWPTHCRRSFGPDDPTGDWKVTMKQGERTLVTERFKAE
jgi:hypothetical protein